MKALHVAISGLALAGVFVACTLIDPLDDISGGKGDAGKKGSSASSSGSSSSSGSGDDDDVIDASSSSSSSGSTSSSSGSSTFSCNGPKESEPDDATPSMLASPISCGTISGPGDVDRWSFKNNGTQTLQIFMKVEVDNTQLLVQVQTAGGSNSANSGGNILTSLDPGDTLKLQLTTLNGELGNVAYRIDFASN